MILALLGTSLGQFSQHAHPKWVDVRVVQAALGALRGATKGPMVAGPKLMELLLQTLLQIQFDRFPPEKPQWLQCTHQESTRPQIQAWGIHKHNNGGRFNN